MGMSYAWLGPVGELRQVPCPQAGVQVSPDRPFSVFTALSGRRVVQRSQRVYNSWALSFQWSDADVVAWLGELASGGVVGPVYLYTSVAAAENLVPPALQNCGSGVAGRRRVLAAGDREVGVSRKIPIQPSTVYMVSALTSGVGSVTRKIFTEAGVELASVALAAGASGVRVSASFTTPATAAYMTLTLTAGVGQVRLTEGAHTGFMVGDGVPEVIVRDPERTLQRVLTSGIHSDYQITIEEIG